MSDQAFRIKNGLVVQGVLVIDEQGSIASADRLPEIPMSKIANLQTTLSAASSASSNVSNQLQTKVDAVEGKGLSTEDYTTEEKNKLAGIEAGAEVNVDTNLSTTANTISRTVASSTGTNAVLPSANSTQAGVMSSSDKQKLDGIEAGAEVNTVDSVAGRTGAVVLAKADVGLGNVDNTSDANKPVSTATQTALDLKANLASPTLTGVPAAPTANAGTNTTQIATTAFVQTAVSGLVDAAPTTLDTLNELAAALGDDPNFATTVSNQIGGKLDANTWNNSAASGITSTQVSNWDTAYGWGNHASAGYLSSVAISDVSGLQTALDGKQVALGYTPVNKAGDTMSGALELIGGSELRLRAGANEDIGDIVWQYNNENEKHRLWDGGDGINYRYNGGTAHKLVHAGNYNSYSPTLTGGGASGTWGINITGNAGSASSVAWGNVSSKPSNIMYYQGFTLNADTMDSNSTGFTYAVNAPATGPIARFSAGGSYDLWLNAAYGGGTNLFFRTRNGDGGGVLNPWRALVSYGVNYGDSLYGTIMYDSNNTAYYVDPASTSVFNTLGNFNLVSGATECGIRFRIAGSGGDFVGRYSDYMSLYNSASGGEIKIFDSGYVNINVYATNQASFRAPIFYDSNNTAYYVDPASTSVVNYVQAANIHDNAVRRFTNPNGGALAQSSSSITGAIRIQLPAARRNSSTMLRFTVKVYEYSTGRSTEFQIGGYNYGPGGWYNPFVTQLTDSGRAPFIVRFGDNGSRDVIYIGEAGTTWSYPQVFITDVQIGFGGYSAGWGDDWIVDFTTSLAGVELTHTASLVKTTNNASSWGNPDYCTILYDSNDTGYYLDPNGLSRTSAIAVENRVHITENRFLYMGGTATSESSWGSRDWTSGGNRYYNARSHTFNNDGYGSTFSFYVGADQANHNSSLRAPIFYDSNNTGYYCDPASTGTSLNINGEISLPGVIRLRAGGASSTYISEGWGIRLHGAAVQPVQVHSASFTVGVSAAGGDYGIGNIYATGNITAYYSDERLKTKISNIQNPIEKIKTLDGFVYVDNELAQSHGFNKKEPQLGLSAQQVQAIAPEVISLAPFDMGGANEDGTIASKSGENYLTVDYARLVPLLVEAIKEQQTQIEALTSEINTLKEMIK